MSLPERVRGKSLTTWTASGRSALPELLDDLVAHRRRSPESSDLARAKAHEDDDHLALDVVRHADGSGLEHRRVGHGRALHLGRADALAGDLERVVGPALDEPVAVLVDQSPSHRGPTCRARATSTSPGSDPGPARTRGSCPAAADATRARRLHREPCCPSASITSAAAPTLGPPNEVGLIGVNRLQLTMPPLTSVPPL